MVYKISTGVFMALSAVFASLYVVEKSSKPGTIVTGNEVVITKDREKPNSKKEAFGKTKESSAKSENKTVILKELVSSHPELTSHEIDLMLEIKNSMSRNYSRGIERDYPLLFERLQMDEEMAKNFKLLVGERRLGLNMKAPEEMIEEEREEYSAKKNEILASIDDKIADVLGDQFDTYINYRDKSRQYQVVFEMNQRLNEADEKLDIDQQDRLAEAMYTSYQQANGLFDWQALRENPEKAQEALANCKERYEILKAQVNFLSDNQKQTFARQLDSIYRRFESWVNRSGSEQRRRR